MSTPQQELNGTRTMLLAGAVAGPIYIVVSLLQAFTRDGFDMRRHAFSLLTTGDLGWLQVINFVLAGLLIAIGAFGLRRVLRGSRGGTWGPLLLEAFGVGFIAAGLFSADPAFGFPPGTPMEGTSISWHGVVHFVAASLGFLALIVACFVIASRFAKSGDRAWTMWSRVQGVVLILGLIAISSGSKADFVTPAFIVSACLGLLWVTAICLHFRSKVRS